MNTPRLTADEIVDRIGRLPEGFSCAALYTGGDVVGEGCYADDWMITIVGEYGGEAQGETMFVPTGQMAFLSAVRDKLMTRHVRRLLRLCQGEPAFVRESYEKMKPYSNMELLNHAAF